MKFKSVLAVCAVLAGTICCGSSKSPKPTPRAAAVDTVVKKPAVFIASADSSLTAPQVAAWGSANRLLDSLSYVYADSFKTEDALKRQEYQKRYTEAQNKVCTGAGLVGGYKEYTWVLQALGNPRNKALRDSFKLATF
jgi:hypothetical protein